MKRAAILGSAALLVQATPTLAVDDPRILVPVSDWTLDFADERCSLIREFGDGDDRVRLQLDSFGPTGRGYLVMISGDLVPGSGVNPVIGFRLSYSPDTAERALFQVPIGKFDRDNAVSFKPGFLPYELPAMSPDSLQAADGPESTFQRSITHVTVEFARRAPFRLDTGSMVAPFAAMDRCVDDLVASWGIDPAEYRAHSQQARLGGSSPGLMEPADPSNAAAWNERHKNKILASTPAGRGAIPVRVMLDAAGRPTACALQVSYASEAYEQAVCEMLREVAYRPALDARGHPVASFVQIDMRALK